MHIHLLEYCKSLSSLFVVSMACYIMYSIYAICGLWGYSSPDTGLLSLSHFEINVYVYFFKCHN